MNCFFAILWLAANFFVLVKFGTFGALVFAGVQILIVNIMEHWDRRNK